MRDLPEERIAKTFFRWKKIPEIVITTPISLIFQRIAKKRNIQKKSWFFSQKVKKNIGIIKIPPGRACEDVFEVLSWFETKIIHLGFSCAISSSIKIGDIVFIKSSFWKGKERKSYFHDKKIFSENIRSVKGFTVNSVLETYKMKNLLKGFDVEVTDMETGILYEKIPKSMSINIVSDSLVHPFFFLSTIHRKQVNKSLEKVVKLLSQIISFIQNV